MPALAGPLTRVTAGPQHRLHGVEHGRGNEGFVSTGVLDRPPGDDAEVVAVRQNVVQLARRQGPASSWRSGAASVRALRGLVPGADAVVALRVGLEGPPHLRGALRVEFNGT